MRFHDGRSWRVLVRHPRNVYHKVSLELRLCDMVTNLAHVCVFVLLFLHLVDNFDLRLRWRLLRRWVAFWRISLYSTLFPVLFFQTHLGFAFFFVLVRFSSILNAAPLWRFHVWCDCLAAGMHPCSCSSGDESWLRYLSESLAVFEAGVSL